jgi:hypothetical protein
MKYSQAVLMGCVGSAVVVSAVPAPSYQGSNTIAMRENDEFNLVQRTTPAADHSNHLGVHTPSAGSTHTHPHGGDGAREGGMRLATHSSEHANHRETGGERRTSKTLLHAQEHHATSGRASRNANGRMNSERHTGSRNSIRDLDDYELAVRDRLRSEGQREMSAYRLGEHHAHLRQGERSSREGSGQRDARPKNAHSSSGRSRGTGSRNSIRDLDEFELAVRAEPESGASEPPPVAPSSGHMGHRGKTGGPRQMSPHRQGEHRTHGRPKNARGSFGQSRGSRSGKVRRDVYDSEALSSRELEDFELSQRAQSDATESSTQPAEPVPGHIHHHGNGGGNRNMKGTSTGRVEHHHKGGRNLRNMVHKPIEGRDVTRKGNAREAQPHRHTSSQQREEKRLGANARTEHSLSRPPAHAHHTGGHSKENPSHMRNAAVGAGARRGSESLHSTHAAVNAHVARDFDDEELFVREFEDELLVRDILEALDAREINDLD